MTDKVRFKLYEGEQHRFNGSPRDHVGPCIFNCTRGTGLFLQERGKGHIVGEEVPAVVEPAARAIEPESPTPKKLRRRKRKSNNLPPLTP